MTTTRNSAGNPFISLVVPTFQRREVVCCAVEALAAQEYAGEMEIIVVVDGSSDGTAEALRKLELPVRPTIIEQANQGAAAARNRGAAEASGEVILFLDDDMIARPDLVEQHALMYRDGADAVIGDFPTDGWSPVGFLTDSLVDQAHWARTAGALTPFDVFTGQLSVRRSIFEELGGFDAETFTAGGDYGNEDLDFGVRLLDRCELTYNRNAICFQRSSVPPRQYMRRARSVAEADIRFALKHPQLARTLFEQRGLGKFSWRTGAASRVPGLPRVLRAATVALSELALLTPFRSNPALGQIFNWAYLVNYWSAVRRGSRHIPAIGDLVGSTPGRRR